MKIEHYLTFNNSHKQITKLLEKNNIYISTKSFIYSFSIFEDDPFYQKVTKYIKKGILNDLAANAKYHYSDKDILNSDWFSIRSTHHWSYPQPEDTYLESTYNLKNYCFSCGYGAIQKDNFMMRKEPPWGRRYFMHLHWIMDELFINSKLLDNFNKHYFSGIEIKNVYNKNKTTFLDTVKQIFINNSIKCDFKNQNINKLINCSTCGNQKHVLSFTGFFYCSGKTIESFSHDFFKSKEVYGDGKMAAHEIIVSKKVLTFILDNNINEIAFTPIVKI